jgi:hypothetical protein
MEHIAFLYLNRAALISLFAFRDESERAQGKEFHPRAAFKGAEIDQQFQGKTPSVHRTIRHSKSEQIEDELH